MAPLESQKITVKDILWILTGIVSVLSLGVTIGIFSQKVTNVENRTTVLEAKIAQIEQINAHLTTIDDKLSFLKFKLTGVDVVNTTSN
jgi:hypothetical protein